MRLCRPASSTAMFNHTYRQQYRLGITRDSLAEAVTDV
jgi:hypothetical protein